MEGILLDPVILKDSTGNNINPATEDTLTQILNYIAALRSAVGIASDLRITAVSGTITTVTTVTGVTNIGGQPANTTVATLGNLAYLESNNRNIGRG